MTESKNDDPHGCPDRVLGGCEAVCACCGRDMHPELAGWTLAELVREWVAHPDVRRHIREAIHKLGRERDAARAEVEQLRSGVLSALHAEGDPVEAAKFVRESADAFAARVAVLERRDTAAAAVVEAFQEPDSDQSDDLRDTLYELVRVRREGEQ